MASIIGSMDWIDDVLEDGYDINIFQNETWKTLLHTACSEGRLDAVRKLIRFDANVNRLDNSNGDTPLHRTKDVQFAECLLEHGADIEARNVSGDSALYRNLCFYFPESEALANLLLKHGADINSPTNVGDTLFLDMVGRDEPEVVRYLVENGASLNAVNKSGQTTLHLAVQSGRKRTMKFIVGKEPKLVNVQDIDGNLPIHFAVKAKHLEWLIDVGHANLDVVNNTGVSPLCTYITRKGSITHCRGRKNQIIFVDMLTSMATRCPKITSVCDEFGNGSLHYAARYIEIDHNELEYQKQQAALYLVDVLRLLIDAGCDVNAKNSYGQTPLHLCSFDRIIDAFLSVGARTDLKDNLGRTVYYSSVFSYVAVRRSDVLTSNDLYVRDCWLRTPLHYFPESLEFLYETDCVDIVLVNIRDRFGRTPLHYAGKIRDNRSFAKLINLGADAEIRDCDGVTPRELLALDLKERNCVPIERLLYRNCTNARYASYHMSQFQDDPESTGMSLIDYFRHLGKQGATYIMTNLEDNNKPSALHQIDCFWNMGKSGKLSVCRENCAHQSIFTNRPDLNAAAVDTTPCLYRLRPERDVVKFVSRLWTELDYTFHKPFAKNVKDKVHSFMERMATAIGENDSRFTNILVPVGSAFEGTKICKPNEFDFNLELVRFGEMFSPVPTSEMGFYRLKSKSRFLLDEDFGEFLSEYNYLITSSLNYQFHSIINRIVHDPEFWSDEPYFEITFKDCNNDVSGSKKCKTILLKTNRIIDPQQQNSYFPDEISIDITAGIHIKDWLPDGGITLRSFPQFDQAVLKFVSHYGCTMILSEPTSAYRSTNAKNVNRGTHSCKSNPHCARVRS